MIVLVLRRGLCAGIAGGTCLGINGILSEAFVPFRRTPRLGYMVIMRGAP